MILTRFLTLLLVLVSISSTAQHFKVPVDFNASPIPEVPDYSKPEVWCALPQKEDLADLVPINSELHESQNEAKVDVFFIHPTIFTGEPKNEFLWNASVYDQDMNAQVDKSTILNQASVFNGSCKVYAPRYRQAHYSAFTTSVPENKEMSLDLAYSDVKAAFQFYLENYNQGRPIIIAGHSQGTIHAGRLLKEFFDGKPLHEQLVEAYLVGIATPENYFSQIPLSKNAKHTGGFVTWNTFHKGYYPTYYANGLDRAACVNPLNWSTEEEWVERSQNSGGVGLKFKFYPSPVGAMVKDNMLWVEKPYIPGRLFIRTKIWHAADYNLFWNNIRENVALRIDSYFQKKLNE